MRNCPKCGAEMEESNVDNYPSDIHKCSVCGHEESNQEAEDFDPGEEVM